MAEYIDREEAKDVMALIVLEAIAHPDTYTCGEAKRAIESIPTADVQPVKHGRWKWSEGGQCSECGFHNSNFGYNYCPNCGADMRGE